MAQQSKQLSWFGVDPDEIKIFNVFHDESGTFSVTGEDRWLLHGVLFVPKTKQEEIVLNLKNLRKKNGYFHEVHYKNLRNSKLGPKFNCAKDWLNSYIFEMSKYCFYYCLAIDTDSKGFKKEIYYNSSHLYNNFAKITLISCIAWSLQNEKNVALKIYSDNKVREDGDKFVTDVPKTVLKKINEKRIIKESKYPKLQILNDHIVLVDSNPSIVEEKLREECELIQLVDLMTSSINQAITKRSSQSSKIAVSELISNWIIDTRKPPWHQSKNLFHRFKVSFFPDEQGDFYEPSLEIENLNQPRLFT